MPAWVTVHRGDLRDWCVPSVIDRLCEIDGVVGGVDPFDGIKDSVIAAIRARIATCRSNVLANGNNLIPPEFKGLACMRILVALQGRIPADTSGSTFALTEDAKTLLRNLEQDLIAVSKCELAPTMPDIAGDPNDIQNPMVMPSTSPRVRNFSAPCFRDPNPAGDFGTDFDDGFSV